MASHSLLLVKSHLHSADGETALQEEASARGHRVSKHNISAVGRVWLRSTSRGQGTARPVSGTLWPEAPSRHLELILNRRSALQFKSPSEGLVCLFLRTSFL